VSIPVPQLVYGVKRLAERATIDESATTHVFRASTSTLFARKPRVTQRTTHGRKPGSQGVPLVQWTAAPPVPVATDAKDWPLNVTAEVLLTTHVFRISVVIPTIEVIDERTVLNSNPY
jgi:hypothetical protein